MILTDEQLKTLKENHPNRWQMILGSIYWQVYHLYGEYGPVTEGDLESILRNINKYDLFNDEWLKEIEGLVRHPK